MTNSIGERVHAAFAAVSEDRILQRARQMWGALNNRAIPVDENMEPIAPEQVVKLFNKLNRLDDLYATRQRRLFDLAY